MELCCGLVVHGGVGSIASDMFAAGTGTWWTET